MVDRYDPSYGAMKVMGDIGTTLQPYLPLATALVSGLGGYLGTTSTNSANAEQAQINRDFQQQNSNTAYQRAVKDMKAAGLNPMLAYSQGGASVPSGSTAVMQNAVETGLSSARATSDTMSRVGQRSIQNQNIASSTDVNKANAAKTKVDTLVSVANVKKIEADTKASNANALRALADTDLRKVQRALGSAALPGASAKAKADQTWVGQNIVPWIDTISNSAKAAGNVARFIYSVIPK